MNDFKTIPSDDIINTTVEALEKHGFDTTVVEDGAAAKAAVLELIPEGSEVFSATSRTADQIGLSDVLNSDAYDSVRNKMMAIYGDPARKQEMKRLVVAPAYVIGSAHAITHEGEIFIASATGSQLPAEAYGADHVVLVVSAKKIVADYEEAFRRIREHVFPLEDARAKEAYGMPSAIRKTLIYHEEVPGRVHVVLIKEDLGF